MDAIEARENIDTNGGDDVDDGVAIEPQPTRREVLKAVSTISKYIDELDDPKGLPAEDPGTLEYPHHVPSTTQMRQFRIW
jgi:hypothetical protein